MTTPGPAQATLFDQGNQLFGGQPSQIVTGLADTPTGQMMVLTIRTPSTTCSVLLNKSDAEQWMANIADTVSKMSSSGLVIPGSVVPNGITPKGHG